jgi:hypothetical protein
MEKMLPNHSNHLRCCLQHYFEFMSKVMYLCYVLKYFCYFSEILCYFFSNLLGLHNYLFYLSNNYVITAIIMCACNNISADILSKNCPEKLHTKHAARTRNGNLECWREDAVDKQLLLRQ